MKELGRRECNGSSGYYEADGWSSAATDHNLDKQ